MSTINSLKDAYVTSILIKSSSSRKDLSLKNCKVDILLITGMLSPYATVVEKLFRDLDKDKVTMLKIERAGDVLADTVSEAYHYYHLERRRTEDDKSSSLTAGQSGTVDSVVLQGTGPTHVCGDAWC